LVGLKTKPNRVERRADAGCGGTLGRCGGDKLDWWRKRETHWGTETWMGGFSSVLGLQEGNRKRR